MKKKLLLTILLVSLFVLVLAVGINAAGATTDAYGEITQVEGVATPTTIDTTSRVVIKASDGTFYTFPSYYILEDNATFTWKKNEAVNEILGLNVSAQELRKSIIRMEIPKGITQMNPNSNGGGTVFEDATAIVEVTIPDSMAYIGDYCFQRCYELVTINGFEAYMARCTKIGNLFLNGTKWGENIDLVIPEGITSIPSSAFQGTKIKSVTFPSTLETLGSRAFQGCTNITSVTLPASVTALKNHVFASCSNLTSIDMSACTGLTEIGEYCFEKTNLISFDFTPFVSSFETMGMGLFNCCYSLTTVTSFELLDQITEVPTNMFYQCPLDEINFPKNITSIGNYAYFQHKSMQTEIRIPNGVTSIGNHAFVRNGNAPAVSGVKIYLPALLTTVPDNYNFEYWDFAEMYIPSGFVNVPQGFVNGTNEKGTVYYYDGDLNGLNINGTHNAALLNAEWVYIDDFTGASADKNIIVYGCNTCELFYMNEHDTKAVEGNPCMGRCERCDLEAMLANPAHEFAWVLNNGGKVSIQAKIEAVHKCPHCNTEEKTKVIDVIFSTDGYSYEKDGKGITQRIRVDKDALKEYSDILGVDTYDFGIFASLSSYNNSPIDGNLLTVDSETGKLTATNENATVFGTFAGSSYTFIQIKLAGIPSLDTQVYCGAFLVMGNSVTYVCDKDEGALAILKTPKKAE